MYLLFSWKRFSSGNLDVISMLEGKKYNNNLYAINEFTKIKGRIKISKIENKIRILFNLYSKLNLEIFFKNIIEGIKCINHIKIALFAGAISLTPLGSWYL